MKKLALTIFILIVGFIFLSLTQAVEVETMSETSKKAGGALNAWQNPKLGEGLSAEVLPPGVEKMEVVPGEGRHLGWEKGKHKGWDKLATEKIEALDKSVDKLESSVEGYQGALGEWLNERPVFGITQEGGIEGYRQEIKNWLDKFSNQNFSDVVKEIEANF